MTDEIKKLMELASEVAVRENCYLYDLELTGQGQGRTLRIFIDKDGEEGVSIDDCSNVSRGLDLVLDVEDLVPGGSYALEVSSPGLDRRLRQPWHFEKAIGEEVQLQLNTGLGEFCDGRPPADVKRKKLSGEVIAADDENVQVRMEAAKDQEPAEVQIPYQFIHKAKVIFSHENNFDKKKPKGRKG